MEVVEKREKDIQRIFVTGLTLKHIYSEIIFMFTGKFTVVQLIQMGTKDPL
jgi:hypothetical protein